VFPLDLPLTVQHDQGTLLGTGRRDGLPLGNALHLARLGEGHGGTSQGI
jgi:hypothetical protein